MKIKIPRIIKKILGIILIVTCVRWGGIRFISGLFLGMLGMGWLMLTDNLAVKSFLKLIGVADYETNTKNTIKEEIKEENKYKVKFSK